MSVKLRRGEIEIRPYSDGSGARHVVKFDGSEKNYPMRIESGSDNWVYLERDDVMPLIEALTRAYNEVFPPEPIT